MTAHSANPTQILLVEDNPGDVRLTQEAMRDARVTNEIHVARDGVEAMQYLRGEPPFAGAVRPDLILLDLNLPKRDGRQVLAEIKTDPSLRRIPVVILTTSDSRSDVLRSYDLHANCYITKPIDLDDFVDVVRSVEDFWLRVVRLPAEDE